MNESSKCADHQSFPTCRMCGGIGKVSAQQFSDFVRKELYCDSRWMRRQFTHTRMNDENEFLPIYFQL